LQPGGRGFESHPLHFVALAIPFPFQFLVQMLRCCSTVKSLNLLLALVAAAPAVSCGDHSSHTVTQPDAAKNPSSLVVSLVTPHTDDGALIIVLTGPDVASVVSSRYLVYARAAGAGKTSVIVVGDLVAGPLMTVRLAAPHELEAYAGHVDEVARRMDALRDTLTGYGVTIGPAAP
jgi:hypothetical protein